MKTRLSFSPDYTKAPPKRPFNARAAARTSRAPQTAADHALMALAVGLCLACVGGLLVTLFILAGA